MSGGRTLPCGYQPPNRTAAGSRSQLGGKSLRALRSALDTPRICDEALKLAKIEWEILPFELDPEKGRRA